MNVGGRSLTIAPRHMSVGLIGITTFGATGRLRATPKSQ